MYKLLILGLLLITSFEISASTDTDIDVEKLISQKNYLNSINQCTSNKSFSTLLKNAIKNADKSEYRASYAANIEEIILQKPSCFVSSAEKLSFTDCKKLSSLYIKEPFFNPRFALDDSLSKVKSFNNSCLAS
jgi:spore coat protein U-like protein